MRESNQPGPSEPEEQYVPEKKELRISFIALGAALGAAVGAALDNLAIGIAMGVALGAMIDGLRSRNR